MQDCNPIDNAGHPANKNQGSISSVTRRVSCQAEIKGNSYFTTITF